MSLIRCKHERPNGSLVTFGFKDQPDYREYHFKPRSQNGPHVAEVTEDGDIATLLAIESAYETFTDGVKVSPASTPEPVTKTSLPQPKRHEALLKAVGVMTEDELRLFASERYPNHKLDTTHSADQLRTYLKGLIEKG